MGQQIMEYRKIDEQMYTNVVQSHPQIVFPVEQSPEWGRFQDHIPDRTYIGTYLINDGQKQLATASLLHFKMKGYGYVWINNGPTLLTEKVSGHELASLVATLKQLVNREVNQSSLFIRLSLPAKEGGVRPAYSKSLLERTTVVDLTQDFDTILASMSQGARRGMRKAQKAGITIREVPTHEASSHFEPYHAIMRETAARDQFFAHPIATYTSMLGDLGEHVRFYAAFQNDTPIAWAIVTIYGRHGTYYYGASNEAARQESAPYLLHIEIMRALKDDGVVSYDFLGIGSPNYPGLQGVTEFKLRFGGEVKSYQPTYDLPLKMGLYRAWKLAEKTKHRLRNH